MLRVLTLAFALGVSAVPVDKVAELSDYSGSAGSVRGMETERKCAECVKAEDELITAIGNHDSATSRLSDATTAHGEALSKEEAADVELTRLTGLTGAAKEAVRLAIKAMRDAHGRGKAEDVQEIIDGTAGLNTKAEAWKNAMAAQADQLTVYNDAKKATEHAKNEKDARDADVKALNGPLATARSNAARECAEMRGTLAETTPAPTTTAAPTTAAPRTPKLLASPKLLGLNCCTSTDHPSHLRRWFDAGSYSHCLAVCQNELTCMGFDIGTTGCNMYSVVDPPGQHMWAGGRITGPDDLILDTDNAWCADRHFKCYVVKG